MVTVQTAGTFAHYQGGGLFRAIDGSGWLFAELPAQPPVRDAGSTDDLMKAARPLLTIMDGLAGLVPSVTIGGRRFAKNFYRRMKILAIATPEPFLPSPTLDPANRVRLAQENPHASEHDRFTAVGVKLFAASGGRGFWSKAADFIDSMAVDNNPASTPDSVFDADREVIQQIFDDAGCAPIGRHQADRMLAWWVTDRSPEVVRVMTEPEHMHVFPSNEACATAEEFKRLHIPCDEWADHIDGSYTMTMATLGATRFMGTPETDPSARWAAQLLASRRGGGTGVIALSVDGLVEPGEVSREQVDRDKEDVIEKTMKQMQDSHKANLKVAQELTQADQEYQNRERAWPTLIEGRVHMAVGHRVLNAKNLGFPGEVKLNPDRQDSVFQDMMIGSTVQYNPSPVFWPAPILAFAGLSGRSVAGEDMGRGDKSDIPGALVGFSEADRIPVYSSPFAAAAFHTAPGFLILGRTGSGKALALSTRLPVPPQGRWPHGATVTVGDLKEGDLVYGRDGHTCPIEHLHPVASDDVYDLTLSDGRHILASGQHQWVAWDWDGRNRPRERMTERYRQVNTAIQALDKLLAVLPQGATLSADGAWRLVHDYLPVREQTVGGGDWVRAIIRFNDIPVVGHEPSRVPGAAPGAWYQGDKLLNLLAEGFTGIPSLREDANILTGYAEHTLAPLRIPDAVALCRHKGPAKKQAYRLVKTSGLPQVPAPEHATHVRNVPVYDAALLIKAIGVRLAQRFTGSTYGGEQVVTVDEMLAGGVKTRDGQSNWAIHMGQAAGGGTVGLPLDPWCLGAWLADGEEQGAAMSSDGNNGDLEYLAHRFQTAGFEPTMRPEKHMAYMKGLREVLNRMNLLHDKHVPSEYLYASPAQRLALVQGLMDQDGSIDKNGHCSFDQSADHKRIVDALVFLLRSLGVVVHEPKLARSAYRTADGRVETGGRWRVSFTTTLPVFTLPRKANRLPEATRLTDGWVYVTAITRAADTPHRCLTVGSPDGVFLIDGFLPTHNTRTALHIASQWALLHSPDELAKDPKHPERIPCIPGVFLDPKPKSSDFGPFVEHMHGTQIMLDSPDAEGILDPLRVFPDDMASDAMDTAVEMLGQVTGGQFEDRSRQLALYSIIGYGRRYGADCTGEAVYRAWRARHDGASDANDVDPLVDDIFPQLSRLAKNNRLFRLVYATRHGGRRLAIGSGLTLLSAGTANIIADKTDAAPSDIQRWVVRMAALGSAAAVAGRDGYLVIDEAWSLLGDQFGVQVCNRMGRIARDQHYMFLLASQKVDEFNNAGLQDFIGRGILHGFGSKNEMSGRGSQVDAALELFNQTDNARLRSRLAEDPFTNPETHAPNWASLYPCRDPKSGRLLRGSIGYYVGLDGSAIPVEININNSLL